MQRRLFYFLFPILLLLLIGFILTVYRLPLMNVSVPHEIVANSTPPPTPVPIETPSGSIALISSPSLISSTTPISSAFTHPSKARPTSKSTGAILNITSTAYGVAIQRYLASLGDIRLPSSLRLPSRWDGAMLTQEDRHFLRTLTSMERYQLRKHMAPGNFEAILARTHHFTTLVSHLITSIPQLIILGAGYDTRCYQLHEWSMTSISSSSPTCYEIDLPTTQGIKRERVEQLQKSLLQHPNHPLANYTLQAIEHTHYIPFNMATCFDPNVLKHVASHDAVDVMCPTLTEALQQAGYDKKKKSTILVEGVVGYLSERCFSSLLDYLHIHTAPGSYLLFDFIPDSNNCYGMSHVHVAVNRLNEPIKFGMSPTRMRNFLELHNFNVIEQLTPADMEQRYLMSDDGKSLGKVACFQHTITAINQ